MSLSTPLLMQAWKPQVLSGGQTCPTQLWRPGADEEVLRQILLRPWVSPGFTRHLG